MPGAQPHPQPCAQIRWAHKHSHHRLAETFRHSLRDGFNGFLRSLPGDRALLSPSQATMQKHRCRLDTSVGVSERYDFAVRLAARPSCAPKASIASRAPRSWRRVTPLLMSAGCLRFWRWFAGRINRACCDQLARRANRDAQEKRCQGAVAGFFIEQS